MTQPPESSETAAAVQAADAAVADTEARKRAFFARLRPIIEQENARIEATRQWLLGMQERQASAAPIPDEEQVRLAALADRYGVEPGRPDFWNSMLARVDSLPVELVLAQAANESGWGTSRFAIHGNNYFGQWCFTKGCGLVPRERPQGASYEVRRFASVSASVRSYLLNINSGTAYAQLRSIRAHARASGRAPDALALAYGLKRYSQRGDAYVKEIGLIIRSNRELMRS